MSSLSPGPIRADERVERFLFSPVHMNKKGELMPAVFSQAFRDGCSIQRLDKVATGELEGFVKSFLVAKDNRVWIGTVGAVASDIRKIAVGRRRGFALYDTSEPKNVSHGEIFASYPINEADELELTRKLFAAFGDGVVTPPIKLRDGQVWNSLTEDLRSRKAAAPIGIKGRAAAQ